MGALSKFVDQNVNGTLQAVPLLIPIPLCRDARHVIVPCGHDNTTKYIRIPAVDSFE